MTTAAMVLVMAKSAPSTAEVMKNMLGSMIGEAIQNAMTGAKGTPAASRPAISGTTPQEQNGDSAPNRAAAMIVLAGLPVKTSATCLSRPVAVAQPARLTATIRNGRMAPRLPPVKTALSHAWPGTVTMRPAKIRTMARMTLSVFFSHWPGDEGETAVSVMILLS